MACYSFAAARLLLVLLMIAPVTNSWTTSPATDYLQSCQRNNVALTDLNALSEHYVPYYPHRQYNRDPEEMAAAIKALGWHVLRFREARLQALQDLSESLKQLIAIQEELVAHNTHTNIQPEVIQQVAAQAVEQIGRLEEAQNDFLVGLSQTTAATTTANPAAYSYVDEAAHSMHQDFITPAATIVDNGADVRDDIQEFMDAEKKQRRSIKSRVTNNAAKYYKYTGKLLAPDLTPGLPNVAANTFLGNAKLSQPMITSQFDQLLTALSKNQPLLVTLKKNQPVIAAELDSVLLQLKKNAPLWTDDLSQLIVDIKQVLLVLFAGSGGGGIM